MTTKPKLITKLGRERMRKMIAYLRELPPKAFNFSNVRYEASCGTVGCVIGWTPNVFPKLVGWSASRGFIFDGENYTASAYWLLGAKVFGLDPKVSDSLFTPESQRQISELKLSPVFDNATPTEVADMLESFLSQVDDIEEATANLLLGGMLTGEGHGPGSTLDFPTCNQPEK